MVFTMIILKYCCIVRQQTAIRRDWVTAGMMLVFLSIFVVQISKISIFAQMYIFKLLCFVLNHNYALFVIFHRI